MIYYRIDYSNKCNDRRYPVDGKVEYKIFDNWNQVDRYNKKIKKQYKYVRGYEIPEESVKMNEKEFYLKMNRSN